MERKIIKTQEDLVGYKDELESAKSSLLILMSPVFMGEQRMTDLSFDIKGELFSLYKYLVMTNYGEKEYFRDLAIVKLDRIINEKLSNMNKLLLQGYTLSVNEIGGYTPL